MGCGQPAGEAGFNIGRVVCGARRARQRPGVTVNRYCSSSLQTIRMAAHAIKAGEGDCFISAGVEAVSRYGNGASDTAPEPGLQASRRPHRRARAGRRTDMDAARRAPRHLHRHGSDGGERRPGRGRHPPGDGRVGCAQPAARRRQPGERLLGGRDHAAHAARRHASCRRTTGRAPAPRSRSSPSSSRSSAPTARSPPATPARSTTAPPP